MYKNDYLVLILHVHQNIFSQEDKYTPFKSNSYILFHKKTESMRIKFLLLLAVALGVGIIGNNSYVYTNSMQPPLARTGAPQESTCGASGCHGVAANTGSGSVTIDIGNTTAYAAGQAYDITVTVADATKSRFGFEMTALSSTGTSVGNFVESSSNISISTSSANDRQYIHHQSLPATNSGVFSFQWVAPDSNVGNITFYVAGMAANGNGNKTGDLLYTAQKVLSYQPGVATTTPSIIKESSLQVFPNPATSNFNLQFELTQPSPLKVALYDISGKILEQLWENNASTGKHTYPIQLCQHYAAGMYWVKLTTQQGEIATPIYLQ